MVRTRLNIGCRYSTPVRERPLHPTRGLFTPEPSQTQAPVTPATEPERRAGGSLTTKNFPNNRSRRREHDIDVQIGAAETLGDRTPRQGHPARAGPVPPPPSRPNGSPPRRPRALSSPTGRGPPEPGPAGGACRRAGPRLASPRRHPPPPPTGLGQCRGVPANDPASPALRRVRILRPHAREPLLPASSAVLDVGRLRREEP